MLVYPHIFHDKTLNKKAVDQAMKTQRFREDINGLRAIAVLSVVIFHFSDSLLPGGFAGVDIFFVISGFLMTSIIIRGVENNSFSLWSFLKARAKRIVPALTVTIALLLIAGYLCFDTISYQLTGKHSVGALSFISNFMFQSESGYFDTESKGKALLHTWSLSVEWQFYIIYPIFILFLSKLMSINNTKRTILTLAAISFAWCVYITYSNPVSSYFMLYSRAWEMMLGGVAYIYPLSCKDGNRKYIEFSGLVLIAISILFIQESTPWPGYFALVPVVGAYLCILASNDNSILSGAIIKRIGLWSYSIYLIHWPILVIMHKMNIDISFKWYIACTLLISFAMYELIEKRRTFGWGALVAYVLVLIAAGYISINGVSDRIKNQQFKLSKYEFRAKFEGHLSLPSAETIQYFNSTDKDFDYILVGDSFSRHYYAFFKDNNIKVASFGIDGCKVTKHFMRPLNFSQELKKICENRYQKEVDFINAHPGKKVIISMTWQNGEIGMPFDKNTKLPNDIVSELSYFLEDIKNSGSEVFILGNTQGSNRIMYECLASQSLPINQLFSKCESHIPQRDMPVHVRLAEFANKHKNVHFIDPTPALCSNGECKVLDGSMPVYTDTAHLTKKYSNVVGKYIFSKIESK